MLVNRNPSIEAFSAQLLLTVDELLAAIPRAAQMTGRWALLRLQTSLCSLGILDEPVILDTSHEKAADLPSLWQNDPTVDPACLAWVCAFYDQTPTYDERRRRHMCYSLLMAGRWLKQYHPEDTVGKLALRRDEPLAASVNVGLHSPPEGKNTWY